MSMRQLKRSAMVLQGARARRRSMLAPIPIFYDSKKLKLMFCNPHDPKDWSST